jgi:hypothetical protein
VLFDAAEAELGPVILVNNAGLAADTFTRCRRLGWAAAGQRPGGAVTVDAMAAALLMAGRAIYVPR